MMSTHTDRRPVAWNVQKREREIEREGHANKLFVQFKPNC